MAGKKCAHPKCRCDAPEQQQAGASGSQQYCSSHCAGAGSKVEGGCQCAVIPTVIRATWAGGSGCA
jgi:hypothetical protein